MIWSKEEQIFLRVLVEDNKIRFEVAETDATFPELIRSWKPYTMKEGFWDGAEKNVSACYCFKDSQFFRITKWNLHKTQKLDYYNTLDGRWQPYQKKGVLFDYLKRGVVADVTIPPFPKTPKKQEKEWALFEKKLVDEEVPPGSPFTCEEKQYLKEQLNTEIMVSDYSPALAYYQACLEFKSSDSFSTLISTTYTSWDERPPASDLPKLKKDKTTFYTALLDLKIERVRPLLGKECNPDTSKEAMKEPITLPTDLKERTQEELAPSKAQESKSPMPNTTNEKTISNQELRKILSTYRSTSWVSKLPFFSSIRSKAIYNLKKLAEKNEVAGISQKQIKDALVEDSQRRLRLFQREGKSNSTATDTIIVRLSNLFPQ